MNQRLSANRNQPLSNGSGQYRERQRAAPTARAPSASEGSFKTGRLRSRLVALTVAVLRL